MKTFDILFHYVFSVLLNSHKIWHPLLVEIANPMSKMLMWEETRRESNEKW